MARSSSATFHDASTAGSDPAKIIARDAAALSRLREDTGADYVLSATGEFSEPEQVKYGDKTYNIFTARGIASVAIVRIADGKNVFGFVLEELRGQGGSAEGALLDARKKVRTALGEEFSRRAAEISSLVSGRRD
jgi:hypothetical protein